jgi:hypothetical protein
MHVGGMHAPLPLSKYRLLRLVIIAVPSIMNAQTAAHRLRLYGSAEIGECPILKGAIIEHRYKKLTLPLCVLLIAAS